MNEAIKLTQEEFEALLFELYKRGVKVGFEIHLRDLKLKTT
jgi:hypothetical protein